MSPQDRKKHTVLRLVHLGVVSGWLHVPAAVGLLDHARVVCCKVAVHIDLLGPAERQGGDEGDGDS